MSWVSNVFIIDCYAKLIRTDGWPAGIRLQFLSLYLMLDNIHSLSSRPLLPGSLDSVVFQSFPKGLFPFFALHLGAFWNTLADYKVFAITRCTWDLN